MTNYKSTEICVKSHCRKLADRDSDLCGVHKLDAKLAADGYNPLAPKLYEWVVSCLVCRFTQDMRKPVRLTLKRARLWVRSGWLRCPECRSIGVELRQLEYARGGHSPIHGREGGHEERTVEWSMAS